MDTDNADRIEVQIKFEIADRLSPDTLENMLCELGDFTPSPILLVEIEQSVGGIKLGDFTPRPIPLIEIEQSGGDDVETSPTPAAITLPDFYLSNSFLHHNNIYAAVFGDRFHSLISGGGIVTDPLAITKAFMNKIRALLKQTDARVRREG